MSLAKPIISNVKDSKKEDMKCSSVFSSSDIGGKCFNEDAFFVSKDGNFLGVFDGHGGYFGQKSSEIAKRICKETYEKFSMYDIFISTHRAIFNFMLLQDNIMLKDDIPHRRSFNGLIPVRGGTTATCIKIEEIVDEKKIKLTTANVGDSTAILFPVEKPDDDVDPVFLTTDHSGKSYDEWKRLKDTEIDIIYSKTGTPVRDDDGKWIPRKDLPPVNIRQDPGISCRTTHLDLSMTRSLGDFYAHTKGISHEPSISTHTIDSDQKHFLIIASDGLWDCVEYAKFMYIVRTTYKECHNDIMKTGEKIRSLYKRVANHLFSCDTDDITIVIRIV